MFFALRFLDAAYTRVKSQVQILYRPPTCSQNVNLIRVPS